MGTRFGLFAASLLACSILFPTAYADNGKGKGQDAPPDGRGDRIKGTPPKASTGAPATGNGIDYHGGPVLHTINLYYIWYGSWTQSDQQILEDFARNDGGSPYFAINTTYGDTSGNVPNAVTLMGETTVAGSSTSLADNDIATIVGTALGQFGSVDSNGVYFVLTAAGITESSGFLTRYCGWHTNGSFTFGGTSWDVKYGFIGNATGASLANCAAQTSSSPNGSPGVDAMVSVVAHELDESATDPDLNAWYDSSGNENADKCAWTFGTTYTAGNGSLANMHLGARDYLVQQNWVNALGGSCALSYVNASGDFVLSASPSSQSVVQGSGTSYNVTVTPSGGFSSSVTLSANGLPPGASAALSPASVSVGSWSSALSVTTGPNTPAGNYPITITASSTSPSLTYSTTVTLMVTPQGFSLSVTPGSQSVTQGNSTSYTVTSTAATGFNDNVALSVSGTGLPASITFTLSTTPITGGLGSSTLNVTVDPSTPTGVYQLTITGTSTLFTHTATANLAVYPPVVYSPNLDQGGFTNTGSSVTNPQGTLNVTSSILTFQSTDGTMSINATFTSTSPGLNTFQGSFSGTLTLNGVPQAITGSTYQASPISGETGNGFTVFNAAYTPLYFSNTGQLVRSDDLNGTNLTTYGTQGSGNGQFYGAYGIALDSLGRIYVADTYNSRVVRIDDFNGTNWTAFGSYGSGTGQFSDPYAISVDAAGKIYVMDTGNSRLVRMDDMNGTNWTVATTGVGAGAGNFAQYSTAVAFDAIGLIYVADSGNSRIVRMNDLTGAGWTTLTQSPVIGGNTYSFTSPVGVALDPGGHIYVADASLPAASVIRVDDITGANWVSVSLGAAANPHSIALDAGGLVLVGGGGAQIVDNMMQAVPSGSQLTNYSGGYGSYYVFGATLPPLPAPRPSAISFNPPALTFSQNVNTTSAPQTITVTNFGGSPLHNLTFAASPGFSQTSNCPSVLAAATSCTASVSFAPTAAGTVTGSLNVTDDSYNLGTSQVVTLNGTGTAPSASVTPASLPFGGQVAGTTSNAQTITVLSNGTGSLQVSNVVATPPFSQTNNCSAAMAPAASCTIQVSFAPAVLGSASGSVTITDNAGTQTVAVSGSGSAPVTFSPTSLSFGTVAEGTSPTRTVTVTNRLNVALNVSIGISNGPFTVPPSTNTCGTSIAAGASCTVGVTFSPTAVGSASGTLTFTDNAVTSPQTVSLSGTGSLPVTLSASSLSFSTTAAGNTSTAKTVTVTNNLTAALSINSIVASGPFAVASNTCGTSVAAGKNCTVGVTFSPTAVGSASGTLTFTDSAVTSPQTVNLSGTGSLPVTLSASTLSFSSTVAGNTSTAKTVTVTNNLTVALSINSIVASGPFAVASTTCGASIAAGKNCTVGVTFSPKAVGSASGTLTLADSALTSPQTVSLSGTGTAPVTLSVSSINFSTVTVGATSSTHNVTMTNHLSAALTNIVVTASRPGFNVASTTCGASIAAGASCTVGVTFSPTAAGGVNGTLSFADSALTTPQTVTLTGTGH